MNKKIVLRCVSTKLYPNNKQKDLIKSFINGHRWIYNYFLELQIKRHEDGLPYISDYAMDAIFRKMKEEEQYKWLNNLHAHSVRGTIRRLDIAFRNFFKGLKSGIRFGYPKFKSKKNDISSFTYIDNNRIKGNKILLSKIGYIRARGIRNIPNSKLKSLTIKLYKNGNILACYILEVEINLKVERKIKSIGIDVGTKKFLTDSNGRKIKPFSSKKEILKIKNIDRKILRCKSDSNNRKKLMMYLNKLYTKIANKRINWLHHIANKYLKYRNVYVEDLRIGEMTRNIQGTIENPNILSKVKSRLNNLILQQSWGQFFTILKYKIEDRKGFFYAVDPMFTSQQCSKCNFVDKLSRNGEHFKCTKCGHEMDADHNAAINILNRGYLDAHLENKK